MDLWKEFGSTNNNSELNYNPGSDTKFVTYLSKVKNERVKTVVANVRTLFKSNIPAFFKQAFKSLESLMNDFLDEKVVINKKEDFAFLGRQYETIARYFQDTGLVEEEKEIYDSACDRALTLLAMGSEENRAKHVFDDLNYFNKYRLNNNL